MEKGKMTVSSTEKEIEWIFFRVKPTLFDIFTKDLGTSRSMLMKYGDNIELRSIINTEEDQTIMWEEMNDVED